MFLKFHKWYNTLQYPWDLIVLISLYLPFPITQIFSNIYIKFGGCIYFLCLMILAYSRMNWVYKPKTNNDEPINPKEEESMKSYTENFKKEVTSDIKKLGTYLKESLQEWLEDSAIPFLKILFQIIYIGIMAFCSQAYCTQLEPPKMTHNETIDNIQILVFFATFIITFIISIIIFKWFFFIVPLVGNLIYYLCYVNKKISKK